MSSEYSETFEPLDLPEGCYLTQFSSQHSQVFGLDQNGNLYKWGKRYQDTSSEAKLYGQYTVV